MKMPQLRAVVAVVDRAARPLRNIQRSFNQAVVVPAAMARVRFAALGRDVGLQRVGRNLAAVTRQAQGFASGAMKAVGALGLLGGAASIAGLAALTRAHASAAAMIRDTATRLGLGARELVGYRYAAEQAGASSEILDKGIQSLSLRMQDAATGKNQDVLALFQKLGINVRDATGKVRRAADVLPELATAFSKNENAALRSRMAAALFGEEGIKLIPVLAQGRTEFERMAAEGRRLSGVTDDMVKRAGALGDAYTKLDASVGGLRNVVADKLVPVLAPLLDRMSEWIVANREIIGQRVAEAVDGIARAVGRVDFDALARTASSVVGVLGDVVDMFGGAENAMLALVALAILPTALRIAQFALTVGQLGFSLGQLFVNVVALGVGFGRLFVKLGPIARAVGLAKGAFTGLVSFFAGAPFGVILAAVAVVAGAVYLIYRNWDGVAAYFSALADTLGAAFGGLADVVGGVLSGDFARAADGLARVWDGVAALWRLPFDALAGTVRAIAREIDGLFGTSIAGTADRVVGAFAGLGDRLGGVLGGMVQIVRGAFGIVAALVRGDWGGALDAARSAVDGWASAVGNVFGGVRDVVVGLVSALDAQLGARLGAVLDGIGNGVRDAVAVIAGVLRGDFAGVLAVARAAVDGWATGLGDLFGGVRDDLAGLFDGAFGRRVAGVLDGAAAAVGGAVGTIVALFRGDFAGTLDAARSVVDGWASAVGNVFGGVRDLVTGLVSVVDAQFRERLGRLLGAVEDKLDGLIAPFRRLRDAARSVLAAVGIGDDPEPEAEAAADAPPVQRGNPNLRGAAARRERRQAEATAAALQRVQVDGRPGESGRVAVEVDFRNVPQGAAVRTSSQGRGLDVETGVSMAPGSP